MLTQTLGHWWLPDGWGTGYCQHDSSISSLDCGAESTAEQVDTDIPLFIPSPVDLHVHGGGGYDCMAGEVALRGMLMAAAESGTGALLATSVTAPFEDITRFLQDVENVMQSPDEGAALLLGAHLEGPFINPDKLGAQPPHSQPLHSEQLELWLATGVVRVVTFAPEVDPDAKLISLCQQYNAKAQIGHTLCTWQQAQQALRLGCGVTHLYNAMSGVQSRSGGAAVAALAYADFAEIITDGLHVEEAAFNAAYRAIPNLYSVTDATSATGMPDGDYQLGSLSMQKIGNAVRLADGTLAGSCLTQLRSIAVLREWGLDWHSIALLTSARPACWITAEGVGTIAPGSVVNWLEITHGQVVARWHCGVRTTLNHEN